MSGPATARAGALSPDYAEHPLLDVDGLSVGFVRDGAMGLAVSDVAFSISRGKTLCLVGESGSGKTVTALSLLRLLPSPPAYIPGGSVRFAGLELTSLPENELRKIRGNRAAFIFQDPMTSLNPVMRIGAQMTEGLRLHKGLSRSEADEAAVAMLARVGIADPAARVRDFPHQMSGGMRQRVMIGMALACNPDLIIADEPTTALDVTVQRQILRLMRQLLRDSGSALLLITHDLGVVGGIADDVAVMYAGGIVEQGPASEVLSRPLHPYTHGLLASRPAMAGRQKRLDAIPGAAPDLWSRPGGCPFHPRCARALPRCAGEQPPFFAAKERKSRCWLLEGQCFNPHPAPSAGRLRPDGWEPGGLPPP
ncbi:MAG: ABC transporter ATP-binding protein [Desulfovibrio sp.]|nr:ABC transporter ATP-binding protein [Desulfovibrio sp.]